MHELPDWDDPALDAEVIEYKRDEKIDDAKETVLRFFEDNATEVFYERQLAIIFEREYFHWITVKALSELAHEGSIQSETLELAPNVSIRFFRMRTNRYWRRQAKATIKLVRDFRTQTSHARLAIKGNCSSMLLFQVPVSVPLPETPGPLTTETGL